MKKRNKYLTVLSIIKLLFMPLYIYAEGSSSVPTFCERIQREFSSQYIKEDSAALCIKSANFWFDDLKQFEHFSDPITFASKGSSNFKVLILSPKWSSAYDESTSTLIEHFNKLGLKARFILFNYEGNEEQAYSIVKTAERNNIDLIYSMGSSTTSLLTRVYSNGVIPVVSVCSKDPVSMGQVDPLLGISNNNIAYTSLNINVSTQIAYFKEKFLSKLAHIAVIYDQNNPSSYVTQVKPLIEYLQNSDDEITLKLIKVDLTESINTLAQNMAQFVRKSEQLGDSLFLITGSSELFSEIKTINNHAATIPVVSVTPSHVTSGDSSVFMAIGVSFQTNAILAANYGYRVLIDHTLPGKLPVGIVSTPDISINFLKKPDKRLKVPFGFFEDAVMIYNYEGNAVRLPGQLSLNK
jgi:putative ABC transport system substrate-binding protein